MYDKELYSFCDEHIRILEGAVNRFVDKLDLPDWTDDKKYICYSKPTSRHYQVLKAVRIVSGLYSMRLLVENGMIEESGVLARTITHFQTEIEFVQEAHETGEPTKKQQEIVDSFFKKKHRIPDLDKDIPKAPTVGRKYVRASIARTLEPFAEYNRTRRILEAVDYGLDGYVHGEYPHTMELYQMGDAFRRGKFRMSGMLGTPGLKTWQWQLVNNILKSYNSLCLIANTFGMNELFDVLKEKRVQIEESDTYKTLGAITQKNVERTYG